MKSNMVAELASEHGLEPYLGKVNSPEFYAMFGD